MDLIHRDTHDLAFGPRWTVIRQPDGCNDPMVVTFLQEDPARLWPISGASARYELIGESVDH